VPQQQLITVDVHQHVGFNDREAEIPSYASSISTLAVNAPEGRGSRSGVVSVYDVLTPLASSKATLESQQSHLKGGGERLYSNYDGAANGSKMSLASSISVCRWVYSDVNFEKGAVNLDTNLVS